MIDTRESHGKRTASIESLIGYLPETSKELGRDLRSRLKSIRRECESLDQWRNRHLAHRDESTVFQEHPKPLEPIQAAAVRHALEFFAATLTDVSNELGFNLTYALNQEVDHNLDVMELIRELDGARHL